MSNTIIHCVIDIFIKPESIEKVRPILLEIIDNVRQQEDCLTHKLFENINDKFQFTLMEVWKSEDAFEDHLQSDFIKKISNDVKDDLTKTVDIKRYKSIETNSDRQNKSTTSHLCILF
jgi:quinol monooxygenase YgiN